MPVRMPGYFRELDDNIARVFTPVVKWILYVTVVVFLVTIIASGFAQQSAYRIFDWLGASVQGTILRLKLWQLLTYAFVHASFGHLLFNLLALFFFATRLETRWGSATFFRFCVVVIAGAVLFHLAIAAAVAQPGAVIVGISGLVYGVILVYALYYPDDPVYIWGVFPIKVKYLAAILGLLAFMSSFQSAGSNIAHLTHLGGLVFGYIFYRNSGLFDWIWVPKMFRITRVYW